jgi:metallo-beta-lactamase family protein
LEIEGKKILIDCGMHQGPQIFESQGLGFMAAEIDYVLLTHAHIDHSGNLPLLYAEGFNGTVYATSASCELCNIMLKDSAHIQESEADWKNKKAMRAGSEAIKPLYTMKDAEGVLKLFRPYEYGVKFNVCKGVTAEFVDAGHLLGSSSIILDLEEDGEKKRVVFSGDIGNTDRPLLNNPTHITDADYIIMESTYGDRNHETISDFGQDLAGIIQDTFDRGGNVVIPAFAVGRTQELLYFIRKIKEQKMVTGHGDFPVYIDSPLAIEATSIFNAKTMGYFDEEAMSLIQSGINPIQFSNLRLSVTSDDSKFINTIKEPKVIISASGMCEAGRIRHHLKYNLWREDSTIVFVGYQVEGTLGNILLNGAERIKLKGDEIEVNAKIVKIDSISAHADKDELITWLSYLNKAPQRVFVVHGENRTAELFTESIIWLLRRTTARNMT